MTRRGITVYLPPDLESKVKRLAFEQHRSDSSVIAECVRMRVNAKRDEKAASSGDLNVHRLNARLDRIIGDGIVMKEVVLLFIRVWLEHNPPIDEEHEDAAAASAEARFERFLEAVRNGLSGASPLETPKLDEPSNVEGELQGQAQGAATHES